jgi:hypothetical protein
MDFATQQTSSDIMTDMALIGLLADGHVLNQLADVQIR